MRFGFARAYHDAGAMLDGERPDAVVLVVPDTRTTALACLVLSHGVPLLLEKPPGRTVEDVDRMLAAARRPDGSCVPHQVAFNRRYAPLVRALRERMDALGGPAAIQHVRYEMVRVNRRDPDFSTTAIHGLDTVRSVSGADYARARVSYQELPSLGPGVANVFVDATLTSAATAHLSFCPVAGAVVERACVHAFDDTLFLEVPMWGGFDAPGRLQHLHARLDRRGGTRREGGAVRAGRLRGRGRRVPRRRARRPAARSRPRRLAAVARARAGAAGAAGGVRRMRRRALVVLASAAAVLAAAPDAVGPTRNARLDRWRSSAPAAAERCVGPRSARTTRAS